MVRCWNCEHLIKAYSGGPTVGKLFQNEYCKCRVKGIVLENYNDITDERECKEYKESQNRLKYEVIVESIKQIFTKAQEG